MIRTRISAEPIPLSGLPDGLAAYPILRFRTTEEGEEIPVRSRRRLLRISQVAVGAIQLVEDPDEALGSDRSFVLRTGRRAWSPIATRFGEHAMRRAMDLARAGVVWVEFPLDERMRLGRPLGWRLREPWHKIRAAEADRRLSDMQIWARGASAAADRVRPWAPEFVEAVDHAARRRDLVRLQVLAHAAEDLAEGVIHLGPRAFSQAHFGHTKARDDAPQILRAAGIPEEVITRLGLQRSSRLGLGGIRLRVDGADVAIDRLRGPIPVRTDQPGLEIVLGTEVAVVVVENLQAAEKVCDRFPNMAVVYTAGLLSSASLALLKQVRDVSGPCAVVVDADLGGVRIAEQVLAVLPTAELLDIGRYPHDERTAFAPDGVSRRGLQSALAGAAAPLAAAVLARGYPVEQERSTILAVQAWLDAGT